MSEERKKKHRDYYYKNRDSILEKKKKKPQSPEERERRKQYLKEYHQRPKAKARRKERDNRPEARQLRKIRDKIHYDKYRDKILKYKRENDNRPRKGNRDWRPIIKSVKEELAKYQKLGIKPTLRTMFYRLFTLKIIHGTRTEYGKLSKRVTLAREYEIRGVKKEDRYFETLPIDCFADTSRQATRYHSELEEWQPEKRISELMNKLNKIPEDFKIPRWLNQPHYVEIWIEKKALVSTFEGLVRGREVDIIPFGGFHSVPYLYDNTNILKAYQGLVKFVGQDDYLKRRKIHILYFGDFDPTGEVIESVLRERLLDYGAFDVDFQRIGVTYDQMVEFDLPKDLDAKTKRKLLGDEEKKGDSNVNRFVGKYGKLYQIEVDALPAIEPEKFRNMVIDNIDKYFDQEIYKKELAKYTPERIRELVNKSVRSEFNID